MSQSAQKQTKKQKKALAFRTRQKTSKKKHRDLEDDALDFPVDENQDVGGLADLPPEGEEILPGGRSGGRKGKAEDGGQHQPQPGGSKKRKREGEEVAREKPRKKSKAQSTVLGAEDGDGQKSAEVKERAQPQRFILFIGAYQLRTVSGSRLTHYGHRQPEVLYHKGCHPFPFLLLQYGRLMT
jgi:hypothetical protein